MVEHESAGKFHKLYANLPLNERRNVCCVLNDEPLSWKIVRNEVENNTQVGHNALEMLIKLGILER